MRKFLILILIVLVFAGVINAQTPEITGEYFCCRGTKNLKLLPDSSFIMTGKKLGPDDRLQGTLQKFGKYSLKGDTLFFEHKGEVTINKGVRGDTLFYKNAVIEKAGIVRDENSKVSGIKPENSTVILNRKMD